MSEVVAMTTCSRCRRVGHQARDCKAMPFFKPAAAPAGSMATNANANNLCRRCKLPGHWARDCKVPPWKLEKKEEEKDDDASSVVSTAPSSTVSARRRVIRTFPCTVCGDLYHGAAQCKNMVCDECKERGHFATACPVRAVRLAREHEEYKDREARRRAAAERKKVRDEAEKKSRLEAPPPVAPAPATTRAESPPTPETRPAPELGSSGLFPSLGAAKKKEKGNEKDPKPAPRGPGKKSSYVDLDD